MASCWVSPSMLALKYNVTFFLVVGTGAGGGGSTSLKSATCGLYGEIPAVAGRYNVNPRMAIRWELQLRSLLLTSG